MIQKAWMYYDKIHETLFDAVYFKRPKNSRNNKYVKLVRVGIILYPTKRGKNAK